MVRYSPHPRCARSADTRNAAIRISAHIERGPRIERNRGGARLLHLVNRKPRICHHIRRPAHAALARPTTLLHFAASRLESTFTRVLRGLWVWVYGHVSSYVVAWHIDLVVLDVDGSWGIDPMTARMGRKPPACLNRWWRRSHIPTRGEEMCGGFLGAPGTARDSRNHPPTR